MEEDEEGERGGARALGIRVGCGWGGKLPFHHLYKGRIKGMSV